MEPKIPTLLPGHHFVDDRGILTFHNGFCPQMAKIKRFYTVQNHTPGFIRAWHGHRKEAKFVTVLRGAAKVGVVQPDQWTYPVVFAQKISEWLMLAEKPEMLYIPPGHYNGFETLTQDTLLMFFSTATVEESMADDFRLPWNQWDIWQENYR